MRKILSIFLLICFFGEMNLSYAANDKAILAKEIITERAYIVKNISDGENIIEQIEQEISEKTKSQLETMLQENNSYMLEAQWKMLHYYSYITKRIEYKISYEKISVSSSYSTVIWNNTSSSSSNNSTTPLVTKVIKTPSYSWTSPLTIWLANNFYYISPYSPNLDYPEIIIIENSLNFNTQNKILSFLLKNKITVAENIQKQSLYGSEMIEFMNENNITDFPVVLIKNYDKYSWGSEMKKIITPLDDSQAVVNNALFSL